MLAYDYPLLGVFWTMLWWFLLFAWIVLVFQVIADIFRSDDLGGVGITVSPCSDVGTGGSGPAPGRRLGRFHILGGAGTCRTPSGRACLRRRSRDGQRVGNP